MIPIINVKAPKDKPLLPPKTKINKSLNEIEELKFRDILKFAKNSRNLFINDFQTESVEFKKNVNGVSSFNDYIFILSIHIFQQDQIKFLCLAIKLRLNRSQN